MNKYETIFIMKPDITQEQANAVISKVESYIKENGTILISDDKGIKDLSYNVKNYTQGHFYLILFECESTAIYELERIYRITDEIMKFMTIKKEKGM